VFRTLTVAGVMGVVARRAAGISRFCKTFRTLANWLWAPSSYKKVFRKEWLKTIQILRFQSRSTANTTMKMEPFIKKIAIILFVIVNDWKKQASVTASQSPRTPCKHSYSWVKNSIRDFCFLQHVSIQRVYNSIQKFGKTASRWLIEVYRNANHSVTILNCS